ncbi:hypothetical protein HS125_04510 [bacterium]|nr:hypothetical protein [bacterium]
MPEPKFSILEAQFPDGGLDRKRPFWLQPPFTTPDCMNVWPYGAVPGRLRGGSRPGLAKAFAQRVGVGGPVRMLQCVSMVRRETLTTHVENLKDGRTAPGDGWRPAYDPESPYGAPTEIEPIEGVGLGVWGSGGIGGGDWAAYAWSDSHRIDRARPYVLEATVVPQEWTQNGALTLLACMDSPNSDAIRQSATFSVYANTDAGTWTSEFGFNRLRDDGFADFTVVPADGGDLDQYLTLRLEIRGSNFVAYVNGVRVGEAVASPAFTGSAVGWMVTSFQEAVAAAITTWSIRYHDVEGEEVHRTAVVASADGRLYAENVLGELDEVTGDYLETEDGDAITDENDDPIEISGASLLAEASLASAERLQQVFIADYGDRRVNDVACSVAVDSEGAKVTAASISDWTALGIDQENHGAIILPRTDGQADAVAPGTYRIINVRPGELVLLAGAEIGEGDCTLRVERVPKVYDSATGSLEPWIARTGQVPGGCGLLAVYRDRLVLARDHAWYMTRQGDPYDLDYAGADAGDAQRPVAGPASDAGTLGQEITALMPHSDDYMLVGCENSLWVMRGDPAAGGARCCFPQGRRDSGQAWCSARRGPISWPGAACTWVGQGRRSENLRPETARRVRAR